jgi:hypothetical protein
VRAGKSRIISLNKLLPKICDRLERAFGAFRYRAELAPDLWPVQIDPPELEFMMMTIADYIRKETRRRTVILSARNIRFVKPEPAIGLTGRYVAVSLSDGGRIAQLRPPAREQVIPAGLGTDVSLDQVCIRAKGFGGAATVGSVRTGRNTVATIVTYTYRNILQDPMTAPISAPLVACGPIANLAINCAMPIKAFTIIDGTLRQRSRPHASKAAGKRPSKKAVCVRWLH